MKKRILLLSPYDTLSHQYWWTGLKYSLPEYDWTILNLPPRYFSWRMRGNSFTWAYEQKQALSQQYDLLIACSMTDLSSLRGFIPSLGNIPTIIYCHENQFFYPGTDRQQGRLEQQMIQIYNFECADRIVFNSRFNQQTCHEGISKLFKKLPDYVPGEALGSFRDKSSVLPIPLLKKDITDNDRDNDCLQIVWNHRWEYDKGLEQLECFVRALIESKINCRVHLLGQQFRQIPESLKRIVSLLDQHKIAGHSGFIEDTNDYWEVLSNSHVVLSSSLHEFQGIAVMEAVLAGCIPLLPDRLCYPEFFSQDFLYSSVPESPIEEAGFAVEKLIQLSNKIFSDDQYSELRKLACQNIPLWENKKADYQTLFKDLIASF